MDLARVPRALGAYWRAQVHLWEVYLSADPWPPRHPGGEPLHWAGRRLRGSVLPGP
ncbi:hypothetical protein ACI78R_10125 [Geodermatophilus sp. SYSU D01106]